MSGFSSKERVLDYLATAGHDFVSEVIERSGDEALLLVVPITRLGSVARKGTTSKRQLSFLRNDILRRLNLRVEFVLTSDELRNAVEPVVRSALENKFAGMIQTCFVSLVTRNEADLWLEVVRENAGAGTPSANDVDATVRPLLDAFGVRLRVVRLAVSAPIGPALPHLLSELKIAAPATLQELTLRLHAQAEDAASERSVSTMLDSLRRKGYVLRTATGAYVLTHLGLQATPGGVRRGSSDVKRVLALARRKWR